MIRQFICIIFALIAVQASGDFRIAHSPNSLQFQGNEQILQSLLKEIFPAALGCTVKKKSTWEGIRIKDPFNPASALVCTVVDGMDTLGPHEGKTYSMDVDEVEETTWQALTLRLQGCADDPTLVRINIADGLDALGQSALGELKPTVIDESYFKELSSKTEEGRKFLEEVQLLHAIAKNVPSAIVAKKKGAVYWFVTSRLRPVLDYYGADSVAAQEALTLFYDALEQLESAYIQVYKGKVLIAEFTNNAAHVRHARSVSGSGRLTNATSTDINASKDYDETYPVMFNIFLWFGVLFVFSLMAVCITIADMDPGRDSIIYRMTSNRMKKDN